MRDRILIGSILVLVCTLVLGMRVLNDSLGEENSLFAHLVPEFLLAQVSPAPDEALFFLTPATSNVTTPNAFSVELRMGASVAVTSVRAYLNFNPSLISVNSISTTGSAFQTVWEQTSTNNQVRIQASTPGGFIGNNGLLATITFNAVAAGEAALTYDVNSLALKTDDTDILNIAASTSGSYTIVAGASPPPPSGGGGGGGGGGTAGGSTNSAGDCSGDKKANIFDLSLMLSNWQKAASTCDLTNDGIVNIFDLSILLSNWTG